jgi:hypothetical protein
LKTVFKEYSKKIAAINQGLGGQKLKKNKEFRLNKNFMTFGSLKMIKNHCNHKKLHQINYSIKLSKSWVILSNYLVCLEKNIYANA